MTSFSPRLTNNAIFSPFRSSKAFVATVVPILIHSMLEASIFWSRGKDFPVSCSKTLRIPSVCSSDVV